MESSTSTELKIFELMLAFLGKLLFSVSFFRNAIDQLCDRIAIRIFFGRPSVLTEAARSSINNFFAPEGITVHGVVDSHRAITFKSGDAATFPEFDQEKANDYATQFVTDGKFDEPAIYLKDKFSLATDISVAVIDKYSKAKAITDSTVRHQMRMLGANNLCIDRSSSKFLLHLRALSSDTGQNLVHGSGGLYLPKIGTELRTRKDDRKRLRTTAARELLEELNVTASHLQNYVAVIEESHSEAGAEALGHMTFFYIALFSDGDRGPVDNPEGRPIEVDITADNIRDIVIHGQLKIGESAFNFHPQLRAMLSIWVATGCPGAKYSLRRSIVQYGLLEAFLPEKVESGNN